MEITIDVAIEELQRQIVSLTEHGNINKQTQSLEKAVEVMKKYQKIEEISERYQKDENYYYHMAWFDVMEILGNGNDEFDDSISDWQGEDRWNQTS